METQFKTQNGCTRYMNEQKHVVLGLLLCRHAHACTMGRPVSTGPMQKMTRALDSPK